MAKIEFDKDGQRFYETGVKDCVLYPYDANAVDETKKYANGVAWNGITGITNKPSGAETTALWADDRKYLNMISKEEFGITIEAYTYPDAFAACDGSASVLNAAGLKIGQQKRQKFGLCYKTGCGNDEEAADGTYYKLHLVYGCDAAPSERGYTTMNDSPEAMTMSWEVSTTPVSVTGFNAVSHIEIDSRTANATALAALLDKLIGTASSEPYLPLPDEVIETMTVTPPTPPNT